MQLYPNKFYDGGHQKLMRRDVAISSLPAIMTNDYQEFLESLDKK